MKKIHCARCLIAGDFVEMSAQDGFFICPECSGEFWPDHEGAFVRDWKRCNSTSQYVSRALVEGASEPGGSSAGGRSGRKEKLKKKSQKTLYENLFKQA